MSATSGWARRAWLGVAIGVALACGDRSQAPPPPPPPAPAPTPSASAPAPPEAPVAKAESKLSALRASVGKYPRDIALFDSEPLHGRLVALLGDQFSTFVDSFGTQGPLSADGPVLYVIGNKPHAAGDEQGILLIDLEHDVVNVKLMNPKEMEEFRERDLEVELPVDVQTAIANWEDVANDADDENEAP